MSERAPTSASQRYRTHAEECRNKAATYRDVKARTQMFQLAAEYDRKAAQAEAIELQENKNK